MHLIPLKQNRTAKSLNPRDSDDFLLSHATISNVAVGSISVAGIIFSISVLVFDHRYEERPIVKGGCYVIAVANLYCLVYFLMRF